jgi:hypothetical protein
LDKTGILGRIAQSITHLLDCGVDAVFEVDEAAIRPKGGTQFFPGNDRAGAFQKQSEKAEGLVLELDERAFPAEFTGGKVDFEYAEADRARPLTLFIPPHIPFIPFGVIVHPGIHPRYRASTAAVHGRSCVLPAYCVSMLRESRIVLLGWLVLGTCGAQQREAVYRLDTANYRIEMTVRFFPPYLGGRLVFYNSANPRKELCYAANGDSQSCVERFVGAVAAVTYRFQPRRKNLPEAATFREIVKVLSQSEGLDERPPYTREQPLVGGVGSDVQAFGYDESVLAEPERAAVRAESRARMWRVYRQELFLNGDSKPFGVVDWKHTLNRIEVVRATAGAPEVP